MGRRPENQRVARRVMCRRRRVRQVYFTHGNYIHTGIIIHGNVPQ